MQLRARRTPTRSSSGAVRGLTRLEEVQLTLQVVKHLHCQLKTRKKG